MIHFWAPALDELEADQPHIVLPPPSSCSQIFDIYFPWNYPNSPPQVRLLTTGGSSKVDGNMWEPLQSVLARFGLKLTGGCTFRLCFFSGHWSLVARINLQGRHIVTSVKPRVGEIAPLLWQAVRYLQYSRP